MPIYEYQCQDCGHRLEALQKISDAPLQDCPACAKPELSRLVSASSFRLKGGGWYETDFKTGNRRHGTQSENQSDTKSDTKSETQSGNGNSNSGTTPKTTVAPPAPVAAPAKNSVAAD